MSEVIDLGNGHMLRYVAWGPDRDLNPLYNGIPDVERYGAIISHPTRPDDPRQACVDAGRCQGSITFASDVQRTVQPAATTWNVANWEPLTLSPSLLCHCGDHGFITAGLWVDA
jgi:hypothetical protein